MLFPTAVPVRRSVKETAASGANTPLDWLTQLVPPFVVRKIAQLPGDLHHPCRPPTAVPVLASVNETPASGSDVPDT
jgi:hypothetical protein